MQRVEELTAYQFVLHFKAELYRLVDESPSASRDFRWASQIRDAALDVQADVAEGFARKNAGEFANFLRFGLASLAEAKVRLEDGVERRHYAAGAIVNASTWQERARTALTSLRASQLEFARRQKVARRSRRLLEDEEA